LAAAALHKLASAKHAWSAVAGPAAAFVASAQRLGWQVHTAVRITLDDGREVALDLDSPAIVRQWVCDSVRRWRWRTIADRLPSLHGDGRGCGALMHPVWKLLSYRSNAADWGPAERAGLRSTILNRQWPQARLHQAGLADDPGCRLCSTHLPTGSDIPAGTLGHRIYGCQILKPHRDRLASIRVTSSVAAQSRALGCSPGDGVDSASWLRALFPMPNVPPRPAEDTFVWVKRPAEGICSIGTVYTDGSLIDGSHELAGLCGRLGWAFVVIDQTGTVLSAAHGRPPGWVDSIQGAELWALSVAAAWCFPMACLPH